MMKFPLDTVFGAVGAGAGGSGATGVTFSLAQCGLFRALRLHCGIIDCTLSSSHCPSDAVLSTEGLSSP